MTGQLIGVDVGGTKISVSALADGIWDGPHLFATQTSAAEALIEEIAVAVESVRRPDAAAVGVGVPSVIEFATGRVRSSVNVPLRDIALRQVLRERLRLPVFVDNDATVAALAEAHDGERLVYRDLVMFTVGTGIGGGLVLGGRVFRGATGAAGELGHTLIGLDLKGGVPEPGAFPQPGSLESLASGRALDRLAGVAAAASPDSQLGRLAASGHPVLGPEVVEAAQAGDEESHRLLELLGEWLGIGIANAINTFDPDVVVVGGGAARAGELLLGPARETARRFVLPGVGDQTEIRLARYGPDAGVRGAALLASQEIEREGM